jgi:hypothetical protein
MPVKCLKGEKILKHDLEQVSNVKGLLNIIHFCYNAI